MKKIVYLSHGHPKFSKGGAEIASWNLFQQTNERDNFDCLYVARALESIHLGSPFFMISENEVLFPATSENWFLSSSANLGMLKLLADFIAKFNPDIIHVHHYNFFGIEILSVLRNACPRAKIVLTLHEYIAICYNHGQMVKTGSSLLCYEANPLDCSMCFPDKTRSDFFYRRNYFLNHLANVDSFVSPSVFLAERYINWGIEESKMTVIENVISKATKLEPRPLGLSKRRDQFAFFGQINQFKGVKMLLQAVKRLPKNVKKSFCLSIHGANLDVMKEPFRSEIMQLLEETKDYVALVGPYDSQQISSRMAACDWVIVPSIWWENSPMVIQEAIAFGRPLIGSNIGGMKEKIEGIAGLTFNVNDIQSLSQTIQQAIDPECFDFWYNKIGPTPMLKKHIEFYENL